MSAASLSEGGKVAMKQNKLRVDLMLSKEAKEYIKVEAARKHVSASAVVEGLILADMLTVPKSDTERLIESVNLLVDEMYMLREVIKNA